MKAKTKKDVESFSDAELFEEIVRKQAWAFSAIYDRHSPQLYGLALKILKDQALAKDVLQETFLTIWKNAGQFDKSRGNPLVWMMVVCRNRSIDTLRWIEKRNKRLANLNEAALQNVESWSEKYPLESIDQNEMKTIITKALDRLPENQRLPIEMAYFGGFSQSEISNELQLPLGTIKTRIRLGMQKLRSLIKESWYK